MNKEDYEKVLGFCSKCQKPIFTEELLGVHKRQCTGQINNVLIKDESNEWWNRIKKEVFKLE